mgnify:CR=1 FL=1
MDSLSDFTKFDYTHGGERKTVDREGEPTRAAVDRILGFLHERLAPAPGAAR